MRVWLFSWFLLLTTFSLADAQEKCNWYAADFFLEPTELDSLTAVEESIRVSDKRGNLLKFRFDLSKNLLQIDYEGNSTPDSIQICFRTFSLRFD